MDNDENTSVDLSSELSSIAENLGFTTQEEGDAEETDEGQPEEVGTAADIPTDDPAKTAEDPPKAAEEDPAKPAEEPAKTPEESTDQQTTTAVPKTWRAEAAAEWEKIPAVVQAEIIKREQDIFTGLEQYRSKSVFADSVSTILAPFSKDFEQHGIDPVSIIPSLLQAHKTLSLGSDTDKVNMFYDLAQDYGIDLGVDPKPFEQVKALQSQVQQLNFKLQEQQKQQYEALVAERTTEVEAFMKDPQFPHATRVAVEIERVLASGAASTLKEAYNQAIYLNEGTRADLIKAEAQKAAEQQKERDKLETKRAASKPPKGAAGAGGTAKSADLHTTVADAYDKLMSQT